MSTGLRVVHLVLLVRICWHPGRKCVRRKDRGGVLGLGVGRGCIGLILGTKALELRSRPIAEAAAQDCVARTSNEALVKMEIVLAEKPVREDLARKVEMPDVTPRKAS